jgi:hypothetical protein
MSNPNNEFKEMLKYFNESEFDFENQFKDKRIVVLPQDSSSYDVNFKLIDKKYYHSEFIWRLENNPEVEIYKKEIGFIGKRYLLADIGNFLIQYLDDVTIGLLVNYLYDRLKKTPAKKVKGKFFIKKTKNILSQKTEIQIEDFEGSITELEELLKSIK